MAETQLTEERCQQLVKYIRGAQVGQPDHPPTFDKNNKRALRQQATIFEEKDGVLFKKQADKKAGVVMLLRVIPSKAEQSRLIRACHDGIDGSHYDRDKTLSKVTWLYHQYFNQESVRPCVRACVRLSVTDVTHFRNVYSGNDRQLKSLEAQRHGGWWCAAGAIGPASVEGAPA